MKIEMVYNIWFGCEDIFNFSGYLDHNNLKSDDEGWGGGGEREGGGRDRWMEGARERGREGERDLSSNC